jgi:transposase
MGRLSEGPAGGVRSASNDKDPRRRRDEPDDHAIGRSRGGLTTKTHALVDGRGRPLVIAVTPGQANDSPALPRLLAELRVPRLGPGRPRTTPAALRGDKAYSVRAHRAQLRARGVTVVIGEPADQLGHRKNKGSRGGRPVNFDAQDYKNRNVVERLQPSSRTGPASPPATTNTRSPIAAASSWQRSCSGCHDFRDTP